MWSAHTFCVAEQLCVSDHCEAFPDLDRDGYLSANDCRAEDADSSPASPEIPGDSVDQNCNGSADDVCGGGVTCSQLHAPAELTAVLVTDLLTELSGRAAPGATVVWYPPYEVPRVLTSTPVDSSGRFTITGLATGQLLVLQVVRGGDNPSGAVWFTTPGFTTGNTRGQRAPPPGNVTLTPIDGSRATISANAYLRTGLLVENRSSRAFVQAPSGPPNGEGYTQVVPPSSGFAPVLSGVITAAPGDVLVALADPLWGGETAAPPIRMPGIDTTPPIPPRAEGAVEGNTVRLFVRTEALATVHVVNTATGGSGTMVANADGSAGASPTPIRSGDPLIVWVHDGSLASPVVSSVMPGRDVTPPRLPPDLAVGPSRAGSVMVSGRTELGAIAVAGSSTAAATWSVTDTYAAFTVAAPAVPGDQLVIGVRDAAGLASSTTTRYVLAEDGAPPAPNRLALINPGTRQQRITGLAQPGAVLHVYDSSQQRQPIRMTVVALDGTFDVALPVEAAGVRDGDVMIVWSQTDAARGPRILYTITPNLFDFTPPLPASNIVAVRAGGIVLVSGNAEINGSVAIRNLTRSAPNGASSVTWDPAGDDLIGSFAVAITAEPGDVLQIQIEDAARQAQPSTVTVAAP